MNRSSRVYEVARVIKVEGKIASLELIDANNLVLGKVESYWHNENDAVEQMEKLRKEQGQFGPSGSVSFVVVSY